MEDHHDERFGFVDDADEPQRIVTPTIVEMLRFPTSKRYIGEVRKIISKVFCDPTNLKENFLSSALEETMKPIVEIQPQHQLADQLYRFLLATILVVRTEYQKLYCFSEDRDTRTNNIIPMQDEDMREMINELHRIVDQHVLFRVFNGQVLDTQILNAIEKYKSKI